MPALWDRNQRSSDGDARPLKTGSGRARGWFCLAVLAATFVLRLEGRERVALPGRAGPALPVICPLRRLSGHPCPGCGLTRSLVAVSHGQLRVAARAHPFGCWVYLLLWVEVVAGLARQAKGHPLLDRLWAVTVAAMVAVWLVGWRGGG